ncbi:MAG: ComEC/Rec2 family competence protein [Acutalibacteraceae bacterium]
MQRPLFAAGASIFIALIAAKYIGFTAALCLGTVLLLCSLAQAVFDKEKKFRSAAVCFLAAACALYMFCIRYYTAYRPAANADGNIVTVTGRLADLPEFDKENGNYVYTVKTSGISGDNIHIGSVKVMLVSDSKLDVALDDTFTFAAKLYKDDLRSYNAGNGIYARFYTDSVTVTETKTTFSSLLLKARNYTVSFISSKLSDDLAGIVCGVTVGDKSLISDETYESFKSCGATHLMAVSGLHASILSGMLIMFLISIGVNRKIACVAAVPAVIIFAGISGFHYSTLRSVIMFIVFSASVVFFKTYDVLTSLSVSVSLICLFDPFAVCNVGFLLSVMSVLGMAVLSPKITDFLEKHAMPRKPKFVRRILRTVYFAFSAGLSCLIFDFPVTVMNFSYISLISPVSNIFLVFWGQMLLVCSVISVILSLIPFLSVTADLFLFLSGFIAAIMRKASQLLGSIPFATVDIDYAFLKVWMVITLVTAGALLLRGNKKKMRRICAALSAAIFIVCIVTSSLVNYNVTEITAIDSSYGLCVVVSKGSHATVIGTGGKYNYTSLVSFLHSKGIQKLDCLYLPDLSKNNSGCAAKLLNNVEADKIIMPGSGSTLSEILCAVTDRSRLELLDDGKVFTAGDYLKIQSGENSIRLAVQNTYVTIAMNKYSYENDSFKDCPSSLFICSSDEIGDVGRCMTDTAFVQNKEDLIYDNCIKLLSNGIDCFNTEEYGNLTAVTKGDGKIRIIKGEEMIIWR